MTSVLISGDRTQFLSKRAIERFKRDIKENKSLNASEYFKDGFTFTQNLKDNVYSVNIITLAEYNKLQARKNLKNRLKHNQIARGGQQKRKLDSIKRCVPKKVFKAYQDVLKTGQFNIGSPDDIINNTEKYRTQISMINGTSGLVSNDNQANNAIKKYFKVMGEFLGIEPMEMNIPQQQNVAQVNNDTETEDEDEAPQLV
jgi:hypothetical protein